MAGDDGYEKLKVADLKKLLTERSLSAKGNKSVLIERLRQASQEPTDDVASRGDLLSNEEFKAARDGNAVYEWALATLKNSA